MNTYRTLWYPHILIVFLTSRQRCRAIHVAAPATGLCMLMPMDTKMESVAVWNLKPSWLDVITSISDGTGQSAKREINTARMFLRLESIARR